MVTRIYRVFVVYLRTYFLVTALPDLVLVVFALVAATLAFGLAVLVELVAFLGAGRLAVAVFLAGALVAIVFLAVVPVVFLTGALALALVDVAVFLAGALEAAVDRAGALALAFVVVFFATGFAAGLVSFLTVLTGLFSLVALASSALPLGANLTFPEGPLGRVKTFFSSPLMMARLIFELTAAVISI